MALANLKIRRWTGTAGSETKTDITSINTRHTTKDTHSTNTTATGDGILVPSAGTNYSYKHSYRLYYDGSDTGQISDIEWYTDGSNGLGTGIGMNAKTVASYSQATGTEGESGDEMTGGADAFSYTSASPLSVTGSVTDPNTEDVGNFVETQATVGTTASAGVTSTETLTFRVTHTI